MKEKKTKTTEKKEDAPLKPEHKRVQTAEGFKRSARQSKQKAA